MKTVILFLSLVSLNVYANDGGTKSKAMEHPKNMADHSGQSQMQQKAQAPTTSKKSAETDTDGIKPTEEYSVQPGKKKDKAGK